MTNFSQFNRKVALLMVFCLLIGTFLGGRVVYEAASVSSILEGQGTAGNPFIISTTQELMFMRDNVNAGVQLYQNGHFRLTNDINLSGQWRPIGSMDSMFNGVFDGGSHTITGLQIITRGDDNMGLFGVASGEIRNLYVRGTVRSELGHQQGGIVGRLDGGEVNNVHFAGSILGNNSTGGIAGMVTNGGRVINSHSSGQITGRSSFGTGGVVGSLGGTIYGSSSSSTINGNAIHVGGIVGAVGRESMVENNTALNPWIRSDRSATTRIGRVAGSASTANLYNNQARADMGVNGGFPFPTPPEIYNVHDNRNGADMETNIIPTIPVISVQITTSASLQITTPASLRLNVGEAYALSATINPTNATNQNVTWVSDNPEIATVVNGVVTGVSQGHTIVRVIAECGTGAIYDTIAVEVIPLASLTLGDVIRLAEARIQANYTPLSWARMQSALNAARVTYNNPTANQALYENRKSNLLAMLDALVLR